jgi:hypothetical protein
LYLCGRAGKLLCRVENRKAEPSAMGGGELGEDALGLFKPTGRRKDLVT